MTGMRRQVQHVVQVLLDDHQGAATDLRNRNRAIKYLYNSFSFLNLKQYLPVIMDDFQNI